MKLQLTFFISLFFITLSLSQTNCENYITENKELKEINAYLKNVLNINQPVLEQKQDSISYKITKVEGNSANQTITVTLLMEGMKNFEHLYLNEVHCVDLEGNQYKIKHVLSSSVHPKLTSGIPLKMQMTFPEIQGTPLLLKLFKFKTNIQNRNLIIKKTSVLEFRDLNVQWDNGLE